MLLRELLIFSMCENKCGKPTLWIWFDVFSKTKISVGCASHEQNSVNLVLFTVEIGTNT